MTTVLVVSETEQVLDDAGDSRDAITLHSRVLENTTPADQDVWAWIAATSQYELKQIDELSGGFVNESGDTMTGDLLMTTSDILPTTDNTGNLGLTAKRWTSIWAYAATFTNTVTATTFSGALSGNADTATLAATVTVIDGTGTSSFVAIFDSATGSLPIKTDGGLTYNAGTANLATTTFTGALVGNADTATLAADAITLETPRDINGVAFDGSANITVTAAAGTLTGTTLNATVVSSSLTSLGTIGSLVATTADINGGTIDGAIIGGASAADGTFAALTAGSFTITGTLTTQHVIPAAASTYDLGATGNAYAKLWVNSIERPGDIGIFVGDWRFTTGNCNFVTGATLEDNALLKFGNEPDYWMKYNTSGTAFEFVSTTGGGGSTDGTIFSVQDGSDAIVFAGDVTGAAASFTTGAFSENVGIGTAATDSWALVVAGIGSTGSAGGLLVRPGASTSKVFVVENRTDVEMFRVDDAGGDVGVHVLTALNVTGILTISNVTNTTGIGTGALRVAGGLDVARDVIVAGIITVSDTTDTSGVGTGALRVAGGIDAAKKVFVGTDLTVSGITSRANSGGYYWSAQGTAAVGTQGVYVKVSTASSTTSARAENFTIDTNNRATYTGTSTQTFRVTYIVTMTAETASRIYGLRIAKTGTDIVGSTIHRKIGTVPGDEGAVMVEYFVELATNDYVELFATDTEGTADVMVEHGTCTITEA